MELGADEGRRQAYLAALGIPVWAARHALPQALAAEPLAFVPFLEEEVAEVAAPAPFEPPYDDAYAGYPPDYDANYEPVPVYEPEPVAPVREARPAPVVPPQPVAPVAKSAPAAEPAPAKPAADFPRFQFWLKTLPGGWQLLVALGEAPDLAAREHQLLAQIEEALGGIGLDAPQPFRWPLNNNPAIPRDAIAARESVTAFLRRNRQKGRPCLLLGRELLPYAEAAFAGERLAVADRLALLLEEPLRKRELWRAISQ